jgi:hypothetical protein
VRFPAVVEVKRDNDLFLATVGDGIIDSVVGLEFPGVIFSGIGFSTLSEKAKLSANGVVNAIVSVVTSENPASISGTITDFNAFGLGAIGFKIFVRLGSANCFFNDLNSFLGALNELRRSLNQSF